MMVNQVIMNQKNEFLPQEWMQLFCLAEVSYLNFVRGPLFVGMRPSFDHLKMFNTHHCGIRKVLRCFRKKPVKNTTTGVYLAKWGVCK